MTERSDTVGTHILSHSISNFVGNKHARWVVLMDLIVSQVSKRGNKSNFVSRMHEGVCFTS